VADYDSSPLMKSALEVLCHSIEHFVANSPRDYRLAVLHLAQAVELSAKAILVEHNEPIYDARNESKTLTWRQCLERLGTLWNLERAPQMARLELLIDERNGMQHRFGTVDSLTIDYHMGSVFAFFEILMNREFGADLDTFLRENLAEDVWRRCRYIKDESLSRIDRAKSLVTEGDTTSGLLEAFAALETAAISASARIQEKRPRSSLDVLMKYAARLAEVGALTRDDVQRVAQLYRLRNAAVHANEDPDPESVQSAIRAAEHVLGALANPNHHTLFAEALSESLAEIRDRRVDQSGVGLSSEELVDVVARRQLDGPPPGFVGLSRLTRETESRGRIQSLIDSDLLILYRVPNPEAPDFPTAAVRLNIDHPELTDFLAPDVAAQLRDLHYEEQ
jgi:hypothetical protein